MEQQTVNLKEWRIYRGLSQTKLSELSGVTRKTIISIEQQKPFTPWTRTMVSLATALGAKSYELVAAPPDIDRNAVRPADQSRPRS